jgi:hypothetical protein
MMDIEYMDTEKAEWKTGTVVVLNAKDRLEDPDNFLNYIINFFSGMPTKLYRYTNEPIVVEFMNDNNNLNDSKKIVSLQDFKAEQYFNEYFQVDFLDYSIHNIYNYFPNHIQIKQLSNDNDNVNDSNYIKYINLSCVNIYEKYFLGVNRIDTGKENVFDCYFKLFNKEDNKIVFLIDKMNYGDTTATYKFAYNTNLLDELTILTILKKIMIQN